jgi:Serine dehydrogenase proteinase
VRDGVRSSGMLNSATIMPLSSIQPMAYSKVLQEAGQHHPTRKNVYKELETLLGVDKSVVVAFFMSFNPLFGGSLYDPDADMLEEVLQNTDLDKKHLYVLMNCPGGDALTAERIINLCRAYSKTGYTVIVPKQAKSAATMICLGASELLMSQTSELGPIDPQILSGNKWYAAHEIIESYESLIKKAVGSQGRIDPYLQQLQRFDAKDIRWIKSAQQLSESIAIKALQTGVMQGKATSKIKSKIKPLLDPRFTKVHGRPVYHDIAGKCGLKVKLYDLKSPLWRKVWELYVRVNTAVSTINGASKIIESFEHHYAAPVPPLPAGLLQS